MRTIFNRRVWGRASKGRAVKDRKGEGPALLGLSHREFRWRSSAALARMTPLQRQIFQSLGRDETSYEDVAQRYGITVGAVAKEFGAVLLILADAFDEKLPWWRRLWRG